jgi:hypothetical protein
VSDYVRFEPDGLYGFRWDGDRRAYRKSRVRRRAVLSELRCRCEITKGVTLRQVFRAVDRYEALKAFIAAYSWCRDIDAFHAQAEEPMRTAGSAPLDFLEVYHHTSVDRYKEQTTIEIGHDFHGIGPTDGDWIPNSKPDDKVLYSVSCTPAYDLADCAVVLNEEVVLRAPWEGKPPQEVLIAGTRPFSLLEVLDAIYFEISFHGGPTESAEFMEEIRGRVAKIKAGDIKASSMDPAKRAYLEAVGFRIGDADDFLMSGTGFDFEHRGYRGLVTGGTSVGDAESLLTWRGRVVGIRDVVTFVGQGDRSTIAANTERAFRESVVDYLAFCAERGEAPDASKVPTEPPR